MRNHSNRKLTLGEYLQQIREHSGISIRELANRVGEHHSKLARLERDEIAHPKPDLLRRIAEELETDSTELLAYIGIDLPEPRVYFRHKFGVNSDQAEILAQLVEDYQTKQREGGSQ